MQEFLTALVGFIVICLLIAILFFRGSFLGLWWYPYQLKQQTSMVHNSNGYVSTQQDALSQLLFAYKNADDAHRPAITEQFCSVRGSLNNDSYLTPDEASFTSQHC